MSFKDDDVTKNEKVKELITACNELLMNIYDAGEHENEDGEPYTDILRLEKALENFDEQVRDEY